MLKITANSAEAFNEIESALTEFDEQGIFLRYFETAVQSEADVEGITVILRNNKKFKKDLNKKKYIISVPTSLTIDAFELIKKYESRGSKRVPFYSVLIKGHLSQSEVNFIIILVGFNDDCIRIISADEDPSIVEGEGNGEGGSSNGNCSAKCPMLPHSNKQMYHLYNPPRPLAYMPPVAPHMHNMNPPIPPDMDHQCPMPLMNCDEEEFVVDTLETNE